MSSEVPTFTPNSRSGYYTIHIHPDIVLACKAVLTVATLTFYYYIFRLLFRLLKQCYWIMKWITKELLGAGVAYILHQLEQAEVQLQLGDLRLEIVQVITRIESMLQSSALAWKKRGQLGQLGLAIFELLLKSSVAINILVQRLPPRILFTVLCTVHVVIVLEGSIGFFGKLGCLLCIYGSFCIFRQTSDYQQWMGDIFADIPETDGRTESSSEFPGNLTLRAEADEATKPELPVEGDEAAKPHILGVKILPNDAHAKIRFVTHSFDPTHSIFQIGELCPLTVLYSVPVIVYSPTMAYMDAASECQPAVFLRIELENGFAPMMWLMHAAGTCYAVRQDGKPLSPALLETMYEYHSWLVSDGYFEKLPANRAYQITPARFRNFSKRYWKKQTDKGRERPYLEY